MSNETRLELEDEDDFTHYFNATGRLSRRVANLEQQLKTALEERDANAAKAGLADEWAFALRAAGRMHGASVAGRWLARYDALSNPVGKEGSGGVPSSEVQDASD